MKQRRHRASQVSQVNSQPQEAGTSAAAMGACWATELRQVLVLLCYAAQACNEGNQCLHHTLAEVHNLDLIYSSMKSSSGVVEPVLGGDMDYLLGFRSMSLDNSNTSCRMVCIRLTTLGEHPEVFGSGCSHFHLSHTSGGTTKHRTTPVTWAGKLSSTLRWELLPV